MSGATPSRRAANEDTSTSAGASTSTRRVIPLLRSFTVFNAAQVEGLPEELTAPSEPPDG